MFYFYSIIFVDEPSFFIKSFNEINLIEINWQNNCQNLETLPLKETEYKNIKNCLLINLLLP